MKVTCDKCRTEFSLGKPKHRWISKENDIALKYLQCPKCKEVFPQLIQTSDQQSKVRQLTALRAKAQQLGKFDTMLAADILHLVILLEQECLKEQWGKGLGFLHRSCPKCGLSATSLGVIKDQQANGDVWVRLACLCGWVGKYPDLRKQL